jgi:hypothetical protein
MAGTKPDHDEKRTAFMPAGASTLDVLPPKILGIAAVARELYAPAAGRLAAAMATIWARRRAIRDWVERSNEPNCRISRIPCAAAETIVAEVKCHMK